MDQPQPPSGARLRTLCHHRRCVHPPRHDPHHAQAACRKPLVMNSELLGSALRDRFGHPVYRVLDEALRG